MDKVSEQCSRVEELISGMDFMFHVQLLRSGFRAQSRVAGVGELEKNVRVTQHAALTIVFNMLASEAPFL